MTSCPDKFQAPINARLKWVAVELDKAYDFLLGMDWIKKNCK